jgi:hypothetical protein
VALVTGLLAAGAATAIPTPDTVFGQSSAQQSGGAAMGKVSVKLKVNKFVKRGNHLVAVGTAIATYTPQSGGTPTVSKHPFTARVSVAACFRRRAGRRSARS